MSDSSDEETRQDTYQVVAFTSDGGSTWHRLQNSHYKGTAPSRVARKALKSIVAVVDAMDTPVEFVLRRTVPRNLQGKDRDVAETRKMFRYTGTVTDANDTNSKPFTIPAPSISELRRKYNMTEGEIRSKGLDKPIVIKRTKVYHVKPAGRISEEEFTQNIQPLVSDEALRRPKSK